MSLRLSPEARAEYDRLCAVNQTAKEAAVRAGDAAAAKRARQANTRLYQEFQKRQLPETTGPVSKWEKEARLSLEDRILRIEEYLKLGQFAEDF